MTSNDKPGMKTINLDTASKSEIREACINMAQERQAIMLTIALRNRALAALIRKYDRGAIDGPDGLLVSGSLDLPTDAELRLGNVSVDVVANPDGSARVVAWRQVVSPPPNGDGTAHTPVLGADGRPV